MVSVYYTIGSTLIITGNVEGSVTMKDKRIYRDKGLHTRFLLVLVFLFTITISTSAVVRAAIIPPDRRVTWQGNVGVLGDIPHRITTCANVKNAPYNAVGDGIADDTSAITSAITACPTGQVVYIPAGVYKISSSITLKSGITVRGAGMGATILKGAGGFNGDYLIGMQDQGFSWDLSNKPSIDIVGGLTKGSTSITTSVPHGWSVGDIIVIDQVQDPTGFPVVTNTGTDGVCNWCGRNNGTRPLGQVNKVVATPTATTAVLEVPLYWAYEPALNPQGVMMTGITSDSGIEELTVDNSVSDRQNTIQYTMVANGWLYKVEGIGSHQALMKMYGCYRCTIRSNKFHEGVPALPINGVAYGSSRGYGIWMNPWNSANLIEDNTLFHLSVGLLNNGVSSGNVIAYNYVTQLYYILTTWNRDAIATHGAHPFMNLLEENWTDGVIGGDFYWGSSSHNTFFRDRHFVTPGKVCGTWGVDLYQKSHYYNIVGNVLGTSGFEDTYELENVNFSMCPGAKTIYKFGYTVGGDSDAAGNDPQVKATLLRHGNWDSVTQSTVWDPSITDHVLPASLYLTSKPAFFGCRAWPAIGPDQNPMTKSLPAKDRFDGVDPCGGGDTMPPAAPTNLQ